MSEKPTLINRRSLIKTLGGAVALSPLFGLTGCGGNSSGGTESSSSTTTTGSNSSGTSTSTSTTTNNTNWLAGGTSSMQAAFPPVSDPLDLSLGNVICTLSGTNSYTIGPCYFPVEDYREDISEGEPGIPMALVIKLVDADCNPVVDADIEVWWCNWEGIYSADDADVVNSRSNFNSSFCSGNDSDALQAKWFRGVQKTDSVGNVYFKACFPGWYAGRTTHIHFRVVADNTERLVSQFCFEDDLCNNIYQNHSDYTGQPKDTSNAGDNVFGSDYQDYQFIVEQQSDGSMLAYKAIQIV